MKRLITLTLLLTAISVLGCDTASLMTPESVKDAASCFESAEMTDDKYIISLDRNCVDTELSIPPPVPTDPSTQPTIIERNWELVATLERDLYQRNWHLFHIYDHDEENILEAFTEGKDLLFKIGKKSGNKIYEITQYYYMQTELPTRAKHLFHLSSGWFKHWGPEKNTMGTPIDRTGNGLAINLDPGVPGEGWTNPENNKKKWIGGNVKIWATRAKEGLSQKIYSPHIDEDIVLRIYAR